MKHSNTMTLLGRLSFVLIVLSNISEVSAQKKKKLGLCKVDCDKDSDCKTGLWCADQHKKELKAKGFDVRKANCGKVGKWNFEVCFDPKILKPHGGGGGGT